MEDAGVIGRSITKPSEKQEDETEEEDGLMGAGEGPQIEEEEEEEYGGNNGLLPLQPLPPLPE